MLLIADSGSTKCDWLLLKDGEKVLEFSTMGFNPYFHDESIIAGAIRHKEEIMIYDKSVTEVRFYGAGCSSPSLNAIVARALAYVFTKASIHVGHDLDGAALATYDDTPHIACILGTGSNSCFFDGKKIHEEVPALAYILGDEGSGSYYGKQLLSHFLYNKLPGNLQGDFEQEYGLTKDDIMERVYMRPHANVFLASFMKFCSKHKEDTFIRNMVLNGMRHFLNAHVACFPNYKKVPVNFVGSVAWHFEDLLRDVASKMGIRINKVVKKPIYGLADYHMKHKSQEAQLKVG